MGAVASSGSSGWMLLGKAAASKRTFENCTLQTLNRWIPSEADPNGRYFELSAFEASVQDWDGVPLVFADAHPDPELFDRDPEAALAQVNGRIVGSTYDPRIEIEGHPRLMAGLNIDDEECIALWEAGKLSLSTAFWMESGMDRHLTVVRQPNHVLVFREDAVNRPRDLGVLIANKVEIVANADPNAILAGIVASLTKLLETVKAAVGGAGGDQGTQPAPEGENPFAQQTANTEVTEDMGEIESLRAKVAELEASANTALKTAETLTAENTAQVATLTARINELEAENAALKNKVEAAENAEHEKLFADLVAKIEPGLTHTEEQRNALRAEFDANPGATVLKYAGALLNKEPAPSGQTGSEFVANKEKQTTEPTGPRGAGRYNQRTRMWEDEN